ncbi:MAG: hypothetical protein P8Y45_05700 [Exilibacterium sp.]
MELLIDATRTYSVDRITRTVKSGKRILRESTVDTLYLDHYFGDLETGSDLIKWAQQKKLLPEQVVLVSISPSGRADMARLLSNAGYQSADGIHFLRW